MYKGGYTICKAEINDAISIIIETPPNVGDTKEVKVNGLGDWVRSAINKLPVVAVIQDSDLTILISLTMSQIMNGEAVISGLYFGLAYTIAIASSGDDCVVSITSN